MLQAAGWRLDLPQETRTSLADFRVAVWNETEIAPTERSISDGLQGVADRLAALGAKVSDAARPAMAEREIYNLYLDLIFPLFTLGTPADQVAEAKAAAARLDGDDRSPDARGIRGLTMTYQEWILVNERRQKLRHRWHEYFQDWDVLLCPVFATPAYVRDEQADDEGRRIVINGEMYSGEDLFFWPGLTTVAGLPSVAAPMGSSPEGLPIGLQIVVPEWHEKRAIRFARLLADEIGGFTPPPGYS